MNLKASWQRQQLWRKPWHQVRWLALDIESNGLNPKTDAMLSIAWVPIRPPVIATDQSVYRVITQQTALNQSAVVHRLSSSDLAAGWPLAAVLAELQEAARETILVAHHARFDRALLAAALNQEGLTWRPVGWFDTLWAERKKLQRQQEQVQAGELTLAACRARYGLPAFQAHQALSDARACAELFLAQAYRHAGDRDISVRQLLAAG